MQLSPMLKDRFESIRKTLKQELKLKSVAAVPRLEKVVVNAGVGRSLQDPKLLELVVEEIKRITGQTPVITRARKSIAGFKLREGNKIGVKVTLRGKRMYDFLDRLMQVALPRVRDFRGISDKGFDGHGNYTLGVREHLVFPEIVFENIDKVFSLEITVVTTAKTDEASRVLLTLLGFPFVKITAHAK